MTEVPKDRQKRQVALGQFYTPRAVTDFMVTLAGDKSLDSRVLEAGFGEGAFLAALTDAGFTNIEAHELDPDNLKKIKRDFAGQEIEVHGGDFMQTDRIADCDLAIGNPPYVKWNNVPKSTRDFLDQDSFWSNHVNGEWDLLYGFLILIVERLKPGGEMIEIIPTNWFYSTYAQGLRDYLTEHGFIKQIVHFGEAKVFPDCAPNTIILHYQKFASDHESSPSVKVADYSGRSADTDQIISDLKQLLGGSKVDDWRLFDMDQPTKGEHWFLAPQPEVKFVRRLEQKCQGAVLSDAASVAVGMVSGADQAYILNEEQFNQLTKESPQLVKRFVKAASCNRFQLGETTPYIWADSIESEQGLAGHVAIHDHLSLFRDKLENRYLSNSKRWFDWATVRNLDLLSTPTGQWKFFIPCIDRNPRPRFAASDQGELASGDVLAIIPHERPLYLLAWLNSAFVWRWYRAKGARTGARWRYTQSFVSRIPVPSPTDDQLVDKIESLAAEAIESGPSAEIDQQIDESFRALLKMKY